MKFFRSSAGGWLSIAAVLFCVSLGVFLYTLSLLPTSENQPTPQTPPPAPPNPLPEYVEDIEITVSLETTKNFDVKGLDPVGNLPEFAKINQDILKISPSKKNFGTYTLIFSDSSTDLHRYTLKVANSAKDYALLKQDLKKLLGDRSPHYGIYLVDLIDGTELKLNSDKVYPPASLSKLPSVVLALRDIDSGKYTLDTTFPVQENLKHTAVDAIGLLPAGTPVTLRKYIEQAILVSSNTAHYHLHKAVLGGRKIVVPRTKSELGVSNFFLDPHTATAEGVARLLIDVYSNKTLKPATRRLLIQLMQNAVLKNGIPAGIPASAKVRVANKEGFLYGGKEGDTYSDAAIVFGKHTDYVLVILNDDAPPYPDGKHVLAEVSKLIYSRIDKP